MVNIQTKIQIAVYKGNVQEVETLLTQEALEWNTVVYTVQRCRKYSNTNTRQILKLVLDAFTLSESQKGYIKEIMSWDMGLQVNSILKAYV